MSTPLRDTAQRRAIRAILEKAPQPMTCAGIHEAAAKELPRLSLVTVYRVLHVFEAEGVIASVSIPGAVPHYELARGHHHHFYCRSCHRVIDIPCDGHPSNPWVSPRFLIEEQQVVLIGLCPDCARAA